MKPLLKICGVTDPAFAAEAARRGVAYVGIIFAAKSPRRVSVERAKEIASAASAGGAASVGVFVEQGADEIERIAAEVGLDVVQLHGGYGAEDVARLKSAGFEVWRLWRQDAEQGAEDAVLLDGREGNESRLADWSRIADLKRAGRRVVLAGRLSAENIASAAASGADVLDVNSSIETSPGVKSLELLDGLLVRLAEIAQP
ncbi:MAG: phosphoribosylanthranilate isomerase [Kiritimatiellae bacterium]|nr:phosphoribosylanthranilate isomerase [Kiritimatiellia bacterium]